MAIETKWPSPPAFSGVPPDGVGRDAGFFRWLADEAEVPEPQAPPELPPSSPRLPANRAPLAARPPPRRSEPHAPTLGEWSLLGQLAEGSTSTLYLASRASQPGYPVALKVMHPDGDRAAFARAQTLCWRVLHPCLPRVLAVGEADGRPFIAMERIFGWTLCTVGTHAIASQRALPQSVLLDLGAQLADALAALHGQSTPVVHGALSLDHLMASPDGRLRLVGLGAAPRAPLSPEQVLGAEPKAHADLFALGTLLATLTLGRSPFDADTGRGVEERILNRPLRPLARRLRSRVPLLADVVIDCLDRRPESRPEAAEVAHRLRRAMGPDGRDAARRWVGPQLPLLPRLPSEGSWPGAGAPQELRGTLLDARLTRS